jgi:hypothetical protein
MVEGALIAAARPGCCPASITEMQSSVFRMRLTTPGDCHPVYIKRLVNAEVVEKQNQHNGMAAILKLV